MSNWVGLSECGRFLLQATFPTPRLSLSQKMQLDKSQQHIWILPFSYFLKFLF